MGLLRASLLQAWRTRSPHSFAVVQYYARPRLGRYVSDLEVVDDPAPHEPIWIAD